MCGSSSGARRDLSRPDPTRHWVPWAGEQGVRGRDPCLAVAAVAAVTVLDAVAVPERVGRRPGREPEGEALPWAQHPNRPAQLRCQWRLPGGPCAVPCGHSWSCCPCTAPWRSAEHGARDQGWGPMGHWVWRLLGGQGLRQVWSALRRRWGPSTPADPPQPPAGCGASSPPGPKVCARGQLLPGHEPRTAGPACPVLAQTQPSTSPQPSTREESKKWPPAVAICVKSSW